jgi:hypothetical protein
MTQCSRRDHCRALVVKRLPERVPRSRPLARQRKAFAATPYSQGYDVALPGVAPRGPRPWYRMLLL